MGHFFCWKREVNAHFWGGKTVWIAVTWMRNTPNSHKCVLIAQKVITGSRHWTLNLCHKLLFGGGGVCHNFKWSRTIYICFIVVEWNWGHNVSEIHLYCITYLLWFFLWHFQNGACDQFGLVTGWPGHFKNEKRRLFNWFADDVSRSLEI